MENRKTKRWKMTLIGFALMLGGPISLVMVKRASQLSVYTPGVWEAKLSGFEGAMGFFIAMLMAIISFALLVSLRRLAFALVALLLTAMTLFSSGNPIPNSPDYLIKFEMPSYKEAVLTGKPFGKSKEMNFGERKVIHWYWGFWGIDNSAGILYDSSDSIKTDNPEWFEGDLKFVRDVHDEQVTIKRLEPCWFYVSGT